MAINKVGEHITPPPIVQFIAVTFKCPSLPENPSKKKLPALLHYCSETVNPVISIWPHVAED